MNLGIIGTLIAKDTRLMFRDRFFAVVTILGMVAYVAIYFVLPDSLDDTLAIGLSAQNIPSIFEEELRKEGVIIRREEDEEALQAAMIRGDYNVGIALAPDVLEKMRAGGKGDMTIYFTADFPEELKDSYTLLLGELAALMGGKTLDIEGSVEVLGPDMGGRQIPPRKRMLPLFAIFIIMTETFGLAALITAEIESKTIQALLVTPMQIRSFFAAKGITGVSLAFAQSLLLMLIMGGLNAQPFVVVAALLLGALLVTAVGFLMASVAKDFMSVMAWGVLAMIVLSLPTFSVLIPGTVSSWLKLIPSYYLVDTVHRAVNFGIGFEGLWPNLAILLALDVALLWLGSLALKRKLQWA